MRSFFRLSNRLRSSRTLIWSVLGIVLATLPLQAQPEAPTRWLLGEAFHIPSEYTNQESGYFSIIEGKNGKLYVGTAKYGVNCFLVEFDPVAKALAMVVDVHRLLEIMLKGFAAQAKIHTRNNVGESGKIWFATKQGYPEKGEKRSDYPGGYVLAYDPKTGKTENYGMPKEGHGVISVIADETRGLAYVSTCDDGRPIEHSHFMVLYLKTKKYRDLGDSEHSYAFIVLDNKGRAYHPVRGGKAMRYDPETQKVETLETTVDGQPAPKAFTKDGSILNWDFSPDRKTMWAVEMSTNAIYTFDMTGNGKTLAGKSHGPLLAHAKATDCRALCVGHDGKAWAAVTEQGRPGGALLHLVSCTTDGKVRNHGPVGVKNPDYVKLKDEQGKPIPWRHTLRQEKDGTWTPWQPLGIAAGQDGSVYVLSIAPYTILRLRPEQLK